MATSTTLRRRWSAGTGRRHHILDPRTGRPIDERAVLSTVVAADGWWAEAVATALIVDPDFVPPDAAALVVMTDGSRRLVGQIEPFLVAPNDDGTP